MRSCSRFSSLICVCLLMQIIFYALQALLLQKEYSVLQESMLIVSSGIHPCTFDFFQIVVFLYSPSFSLPFFPTRLSSSRFSFLCFPLMREIIFTFLFSFPFWPRCDPDLFLFLLLLLCTRGILVFDIIFWSFTFRTDYFRSFFSLTGAYLLKSVFRMWRTNSVYQQQMFFEGTVGNLVYFVRTFICFTFCKPFSRFFSYPSLCFIRSNAYR